MGRIGFVGILGIVALVGACGDDGSSEVTRKFDESKRDLARLQVRKLADEAYVQWIVRPANTGKCPTFEELAAFVDLEPNDPWGRAFRIRCADLPAAARGFGVVSAGADGKDGTSDDVRSWD